MTASDYDCIYFKLCTLAMIISCKRYHWDDRISVDRGGSESDQKHN